MPVHAASPPDETPEAPPIPAPVDEAERPEPKPGAEGWEPPEGTKYLDIFDETFLLQPEIPGLLANEMAALVGTPTEELDDAEVNVLVRDFMRHVPQPHERRRFRKFLMDPRPDGTVIGMEAYMEIYQAACEAYSDFPTEAPSDSQGG